MATRNEFPRAGTVTYLNTAAEGLAPRSLAGALARYATDKGLGSDGRAAMYQVEEDCRERVARLIDAEPNEIAFLPSCARGLAAVVEAIDWRPGDALVTTDLEFPTTDLLATLLEGRGVEVRTARAVSGEVSSASVTSLLDERCRLVICSLVSFKTGARLDTARISAECRRAGALLAVDATQALGVIPVAAQHADVLVASTFKWMLGSHGSAVFYVNRRTSHALVPGSVGWRSIRDLFDPERRDGIAWWPDARRFEEGMPVFPALYALACGLDILDADAPDLREAHVEGLVARLLDGLVGLGVAPLTPIRAPARAGIVSIADTACERRAHLLRAHDIVVWGRDGRLRASLHVYNDDADVDRLLEVLPSLGLAWGAAA
jgi:selenocysteine lyase/cysteine desulfurase